MSAPAPPSAAPFEVFSVHFQFEGGQAIKLVDPAFPQPHPDDPDLYLTVGAAPEWTAEWAAGLDDAKDICDAIFANLWRSGLHYGRTTPVPVRTGELLNEKEAMCGVWYMAFQQMGHCQGVFVHRRMFCVDCRPMPAGEQHWCAIVVCRGGLNRTRPTHPASEFHDNDQGVFPFPGVVALTTRIEYRYRFRGWPSRIFDGDCVNFLEYNGELYLSDACFGGGPVQNGVTVRTQDIPQVVNGNDGLTFIWVN